MRNCPVTQCHRNEGGLCPAPFCPNWTLYREVTGKCDTCATPMNKHPKCDGCGILTGVGHEDSSSSYRGHNLCGHCVARWESLDEIAGRKTTWMNMCNPNSLFFFTIEGYYVRGNAGDLVQLPTIDELEDGETLKYRD